ncbi:peroxin Pex22-like protein [Hirsutella rhossiliensis]|uniref:Peroxin Pex22-like protein n=1 Tax=Hirsutella rhossiliensis TaxID=111463 RepID=A0A9P8N3R0_9HYPO|nr:peroxin Pex22-like protein [Hirsutella rhossiliensis]KAH0966377.1 peroxin Pex22-like protein [Hirsutella rhossiliensis]
MSPPYDRYDRGSSRRGVWTHWVPLAVTLTVATAGLAAWAWRQSRDDENDHVEPGLDYENADYGDNPPYGASSRDAPSGKPPLQDDQSRREAPAPSDVSGSGWGARMSGALRRTPSPQQFFDSTGKTVAAGVAAAGAVVGKALASIREEDRAYSENPWSEEADAKQDRAPPAWEKRRRAVAVVVSADTQIPQQSAGQSILSHIPRHNDLSAIKLYILIYAPELKETALDTITMQSPGGGSKSPLASSSSGNAAFGAIYSQALGLVDKEAMILPFTTPTGHSHILRHIQPEIIYLQESLSGENGSVVANLQTWLRHDVVLVVGAESGSGGLADSESEAEKSGKADKWWQKPEKVGRGRGVVVVDGMRVHDDWVRRVQGRE